MADLPLEDPFVQRCVAEALEQVDVGREPDLETLCEGDPAVMAAVAEALGMRLELGRLHAAARVFDRLRGTRLMDRYRLDERLGAGAMGIVYRALDEDLRRPVAVKLLRNDLLVGKAAVARFEREAEVLAALKHDQIVTVHDRGRTGAGESFLVMELIEGVPLDAALEAIGAATERATPSEREDSRRRALSDLFPVAAEPQLEPTWVGTCARWAAELADGLHAAHQAGVMHRDVKPSNVLLRLNGRPVLIDFGIAARTDQATLATRETTLGTPAYMAPEQLRPDALARATTDVYGLGATLYHLLAGRAPFVGSLAEILGSVEVHEPEPLHWRALGTPRDLRAIVERAMAKRPDDRYPTAADFAADLRAFLAFRPVQARPIGPLTRIWRRARRSRPVQAGVGVALVIALVLVVRVGLESRATERDHQAAAEHALLPPDLSISGRRDLRVVTDPARRTGLSARLDRVVAWSRHPLPGRLQRAAFRLDHGDPAGAAADIRELARLAPTPFLDALANRYLQLPTDADAERPVAIDGLPEPVFAADLYVAAHHVVRTRRTSSLAEVTADLKRAIDLLESIEAPRLAAAEELRMLLVLSLANYARDEPDRQRALYERAYEAALRLDSRRGFGSATTDYTAATCLVGMGRDPAALPRFASLVTRIPRHFGSRLNYASALRRTGDLSTAERHLLTALELQPENGRAIENLVNLRLTARRFDAARELLESDAATPLDEAARDQLRHVIELRTAVAFHLDGGGSGNTRQAAEQALASLRSGSHRLRDFDARFDALLAGHLVNPNAVDSIAALFELLAERPDSWNQLRAVLELSPEDWSPGQSAAIRGFLSALIQRLDPGLRDPLQALPEMRAIERPEESPSTPSKPATPR